MSSSEEKGFSEPDGALTGALRGVTVNGEPVPETRGNTAVSFGGPGDHAACDAEINRLREKIAEYENAITWNTSCTRCATRLDFSIGETERAERAEATLARVRELAGLWAPKSGTGEMDDSIAMVILADVSKGILAVLDGKKLPGEVL